MNRVLHLQRKTPDGISNRYPLQGMDDENDNLEPGYESLNKRLTKMETRFDGVIEYRLTVQDPVNLPPGLQ